MGNFLIFTGGMIVGGMFGVATMCCFFISGQESRTEEKYLDGND